MEYIMEFSKKCLSFQFIKGFKVQNHVSSDSTASYLSN